MLHHDRLLITRAELAEGFHPRLNRAHHPGSRSRKPTQRQRKARRGNSGTREAVA
jgi:hypothetical protein